MSKVGVYNLAGDKTKDLDLNDAIFGVAPKADLVHQVYVALRANQRQPWAHAKDKSDVSGGGRKPWKQKGTGRARHGSNRSPIWTGGGITFGPLKNRNYTQKINKKMNKKAVAMCLSDKVAEEKLLVLENMNFDEKTKAVADLRAKLPGSGKTTVVLAHESHDDLIRVTHNVPKLDVVRVQDVNVIDLMHHQYVIATEDALKTLENRLS